MDALVQAALDAATNRIEAIGYSLSATHRRDLIVKAINAVDALKSALKAM